MKLILKEADSRSEEFRYSEQFIESLKKPGKTAFLRFTGGARDESGRETASVILAANVRSHHTHMPIAIYGYPLHNDKIKKELISQSLIYSTLPYIIIYWVNNSDVLYINNMDETMYNDVLQQLVTMKGQKAVDDAIQNKSMYEGMLRRARVKKLFESYNSNYDQKFWDILRNLGSSAEQTQILSKLKFNGKNITTIIDTEGKIDTAKDPSTGKLQMEVQGLTISDDAVDSYKIYANPTSRKETDADKESMPQKNVEYFEKAKSAYLADRQEMASVIKKKVVFKPADNGYDVSVRLPSKISSVEKDPKKQESLKSAVVIHGIRPFLKLANATPDPWINFSNSDWDQSNLVESDSASDYYTISIRFHPWEYPAPRNIYRFLYYLYKLYTDDDIRNPFFNANNYKKMIKEAIAALKYLETKKGDKKSGR